MISYREVIAGAVRQDTSSGYLLGYKGQGYTQAVFIANFAADPQCGALNGNVYEIDDLLGYDAPLFRSSHVNCQCRFDPYEPSLKRPETT